MASFRSALGAIVAAALLPLAAWAADPQIASFVDDPDPVPAGGLYGYTIRVDNNAGDASANTRLALTVPAGATFVSASPAAAACVPTSATRVDCNLGTVGALGADSRTVVVTWRAIGPGPTTVAATATVTADNDTNAVNNTQTATTTVISGANLGLTKTGSPNPVLAGGTVSYTLTASNTGPNASGAIVITDNLPPSVAFVSAGGTGWACSAAGGVVTCNRGGTQAVGAAIPPVTVVGTVNASGGTITNSASIAPAVGGVADPDTSNNTATFDTTVTPGADVRIAQKTVISGTPAVAGSNVTFQIQPRNAGPAAAANAVVTDTLPAGWTFVSASGPNWTCGNAGLSVTCSRASLPAGALDDITVVATAPPNASVGPTGSNYTNSASIASATDDPVAGNNSASVTLLVLPDGADLRIAKTKTPNPVALGSNLVSTIVVSNNGPRVATGPLRVVEVLTGETYVGFGGTGWTCTAAANVVTCDHPNALGLAVGGSLPPLTITSTAVTAGGVSNTACTGSTVPPGAGAATSRPPLEGDPNGSNDCASTTASSTTVRPDLAIAKTTSTPAGGDKTVSVAESSVTYTLVVGNVSATPEAATGVVITDTVPGFIIGRSTFATPVTASASAGSSATFACSVADATVTCTQSGGTLTPGQTVTVPITVNRPLQEGSYVNTARVSNTVEGDPNAANNSASDTVQIDPIADVEMTGKTVTPASVRAGENATYVLSYRNNGPSPALGVVVADAFAFAAGDTGFTVVSVASSQPGSTCSIAAGAVLRPGAASYSCTVGTLANGVTQTITLVVRPNFQPGNAARSVANTATVTTTSIESPTGGDNGNNSRSATLPVQPAAIDLLVNKTDIVDPVGFTAGATFMDYRVRVTSNGPSFGTNVRIVEVMTPPAARRVRFVCDTTGPGSAACNAVPLCSARNVTSAPGAALAPITCTVPAGNAVTGPAVGDLASGQSKDIFLRFEAVDQPAPTGDVFNNAATAAANEPDTFTANDSAIEQTTTRQRIDLRVSKTATVAAPTLQQPFNWVVTVLNNGPGNALQTDLTDTLPAGVQVTGAVTWTRTLQPASGSCTLSGLVVSCSLGQLDAGGTATVTIPVRFTAFPAGGSATNSATVDNDPARTGAIDTPGGNNTGTSTVTVSRSSIAGTVFEDRDRSGANAGTPQPGEPRIAGVTLRLTGSDAYGNAVSVTATSDAAGNYVFADLAPSGPAGYTVTETQPTGYGNGPSAPPPSSAGGSYSGGGAAGDSSWAAIVLPTGTAAVNVNFPELRRPSLSGFVYADLNLNGVRDAGSDAPIAGATVRLLNATTLAVIATTTTDGSGAYTFAGLDPLLPYTLEEPLPAPGYTNGPVNPGQVGGAPCAAGCTPQPDTPAAGTDRIAAIDLSAGADGSNFNFGERRNTTVSGTVFLDANRNGTLDAGEPARLANITVRLVQGADCTSGTTLASTLTAADGSYAFAGVTAFQTYLVCETQPPGYGSSTPNAITLANLPASGSANNNFGETLGAIAGSVYADFSAAVPGNTNNGVRDPGETGIAGITVTLTGSDVAGNPVTRTTTTDTDGNYAFADLLQSGPGGYTVAEGPVGGFADGRDTAGSAGGSNAVNDVLSGVVLGAGVQATGYLFGELPVAPITGSVFLDRNRNGAIDPPPTDGRLPGVTLTLVTGTTCSGAVVGTTVTDASGNYLFSGASPGVVYTVCETQPAGYADATPNAVTLPPLPPTGTANVNFGERAGSLAGSVFLDANNDGIRQPGEPGIAGVTVTLSGAGSAMATTDAAGNWRFDDLVAGSYAVTEQTAQPVVGGVATLNGRTAAGSSGGSATAVATTPSSVSAITLPAGTDATGYVFGEILPVNLSGTVFLDANNNGVQNAPADAGIGGVTLVVSGSDDTGAQVTRTITTAADGSWSVPGLRPGTYTVTEPTQPPGTSNGQTIAGSAGGTATPVATVPSAIANIALTAPGASSTGNNFAEVPASGVVSGRIYLDANGSGVFDPGEAGIAGVTVELTGTDSAGRAVSLTTTTDAAGNYSFGSLAPGSYTLREPTQPAGTVNGTTRAGSGGGSASPPGTTPSTIIGITLGVGQTAAGNDFGELPTGRVAGSVFADNNDDGVFGANETGIGGVTLQLSGTDDLGNAVSATTATAADGSYAFTGLRPGSYTVTEPTQPPGTLNGSTVAGTLGGSATPRATTPSAIAAVTLPAGGQALQNNFGELANAPDLRVTKTHDPARFTVGSAGTYRIVVRNAGDAATVGTYTVSDRLPAGLTLAAVPTGSGWACDGTAGAQSFSCIGSAVLAAGAANPNAIVAVVRVAAAAAAASPVDNAVLVDGGGEIDARRPTPAERSAFTGNPAALPVCGATPDANACRDATPVQLAASVSGTVWFDSGSAARLLDGGDRRLAGWLVEVLDTAGAIVGRATTVADGTYRVADLVPGVQLGVRFRDPVSGVVFGYPVNGETAPGSSGASCVGGTPPAGTASSCVGTGTSPQLTVFLVPGQNLPQQSLPVDPSGVVYDSGTRAPVAGAVVSLAPSGTCTGWNPATQVVGAGLGGYTVNGGVISMPVSGDGGYQFLLAPTAPASCTFALTVAPPANFTFASGTIAPTAGPLVPPAAAGTVFAVQPQSGPPAGSASTTYYLSYTTGSAGANVVHNHIPLDPAVPAGVSLSKTGDRQIAEIGDSVRYTVTVQVTSGALPRQTTIVDRLPPGFTYIRGTASVGDVPIADPAGAPGPTLAFNLGPMPASGQLVLKYRVRVGVGAQEGDGLNRARGYLCGLPAGCTGAGFAPVANALGTNEGTYRVRVRGGVFTTQACFAGKIFVDCNGNHVQDPEEIGIPGVRLFMEDGTTLVSDSEGKYSLCDVTPRSHVLKVDPITLPRGSRLTTSSNRNLGDANSLWLDLKNGELGRADFVEGSCSNPVLEQVKARRAQGEVRAPEREGAARPALRFESKPAGAPQQATDTANQRVPKPRQQQGGASDAPR